MRKIILKVSIAILLIVLAIGVSHIWKYKIEERTTEEGSVSITLEALDGTTDTKTLSFKKDEYLFELIKENYDNVTYSEGEYGACLYSVSFLNTDFKTTYIAIYINDEYSSLGVSSIALSDSMKICLKETKI